MAYCRERERERERERKRDSIYAPVSEVGEYACVTHVAGVGIVAVAVACVNTRIRTFVHVRQVRARALYECMNVQCMNV